MSFPKFLKFNVVWICKIAALPALVVGCLISVENVRAELALQTIYEFFPSAQAGLWPRPALTQGDDGNFYGTTSIYSPPDGVHSDGTIFRLTPGGELTTLFSFNGKNGSGPGILTPGGDGYYYGVTGAGGTNYNS